MRLAMLAPAASFPSLNPDGYGKDIQILSCLSVWSNESFAAILALYPPRDGIAPLRDPIFPLGVPLGPM
jgi:hypothetical protein